MLFGRLKLERARRKYLLEKQAAALEMLEARTVMSGSSLLLPVASAAAAPSGDAFAGHDYQFTDVDGDIFNVTVKGIGSAHITLLDSDNDGNGSIDTLSLTSTDAKATLDIKLITKVGDGEVTIGAIDGPGSLKSLTAPVADLTGTGIHITGAIGTVTLSDIRNGADVAMAGNPDTLTTFKVSSIGAGTDISAGTAIAASVAQGVGVGTWTAANFGKISTGAGGFAATLHSTANADALGKTAALASLTIKGGDFTGKVLAAGNVGPIKVTADKAGVGGAIVGAEITGANIAEINAAKGLSATITASGAVKTIKAGGNASGTWTADTFGTITITNGDLLADIVSTATSANLGKKLAVTSVTVTGGDFTGSLTADGAVGIIKVTGKNGAGGDISHATITAPSIKGVQLSGDLDNSLILAGTDLGADGAPGGGDDTFAPGTIGTLKVGGNVIGSVVAAGLRNDDGDFNTDDDTLLTGGTIKTLKIGGTLDANSFLTGATLPKKITVGGTPVIPGTDSHFLTSSTPDTRDPRLTLVLQSDTGVSTSDKVTSVATIVGTALDNIGVAGLSAAIGSGAFVDITAKLGTDGNFQLTQSDLSTIAGAPVNNGTFTLHLKAKDASGNETVAVDYTFTLDKTSPTVTNMVVLNGGSATSKTVQLTFSESVASTDPAAYPLVNSAGATTLPTQVIVSGNNVELRYTNLTGSGHSLNINPAIATDVAGNTLASYVPPAVSGSTPVTNAVIGTSLNSVQVSFTKAVDISTLTGSTLFLVDRATGLTLTPALVTPSGGSNSVTLTFASALADTNYDLVVRSSQVKDAGGLLLGITDYKVPFTVEAAAPSVANITPVEITHAQHKVLVTFSESIDPSTVTAANFVLLDSSNQPVDLDSLSIDAAGRVVTLYVDDLAGGDYTVQVHATGIKDVSGKSGLGADVKSTFSVLRNGTIFAAEQFGSLGRGPSVVLTADLDGDGDLDLITGNRPVAYDAYTNATIGSVTVSLNRGDGTFDAGVEYAVSGQVVDISLSDLNDDGKLDMVVSGSSQQDGIVDEVSLLVGRRGGAFSEATLVAQDEGFGLPAYALADLDGDGNIDVIKGGTVTNEITGDPQTGIVIQLGNADGSFAPAALVTDLNGNLPSVMKLVDIDKDGDLDIVAGYTTYDPGTQTNIGALEALLNNGNAGFASAGIAKTFASAPIDVKFADLDNDGDLDVIATESNYDAAAVNYLGTAHILKNNGSGSLDDVRSVNLGTGQLHIADVDGDGDQDLLVTRGVYNAATYSTDLGIRVLVNNGSGQFTNAGSTVLPVTPGQLHLADIDGDGDLDMIVESHTYNPYTSTVAGELAVLTNANGVFTVASQQTIGYSSNVVIGDVDGDGTVDIVLSEGTSFSVQLNDGLGSFSEPLHYVVPSETSRLVLGDFNGDGRADLLTISSRASFDPNGYGASYLPGRAQVIIGHGDGHFTAPQFSLGGLGATATYTADVDGDGDLDVITAGGAVRTYDSYGNPSFYTSVTVSINNGDGTFADGVSYDLNGAIAGIEIADLDNDGDVDLVVKTSDAYSGYLTGVSILTGNGDGSFTAPVQVVQADSNGVLPAYAIADIDADGDADVVAAGYVYNNATSSVDNGVVVRLGNGDGTFADPVLAVTLPEVPAALAVADLDGNGDLDLVVSYRSYDVASYTYVGNVEVFTNDGTGAFASAGSISDFTNAPGIVKVADFDNDGDLDVLALEAGYDVYSGSPANLGHILTNDGNGVLTKSSSIDLGDGSVQIADIDGDGDLDLLLTKAVYNPQTYATDLSVQVLSNDGHASFTAGTESILPVTPGAVHLVDLDNDGDLDLLVESNVYTPSTPSDFTPVLSVVSNDHGDFAISQQFYPVSTQAYLLGDINDDGLVDLVVSHGDSFTVSLNDGLGHFDQSLNYLSPQGVGALALLDANGDGNVDLVSVNSQAFDDGLGGVFYSIAQVQTIAGHGDGRFDALAFTKFGRGTSTLYTADVDGDGDLDLVGTSAGTYDSYTNTFTSDITVALNDGSGHFTDIETYQIDGEIHHLTLSDLDDDGDLDIVVTTGDTYSDTTVSLLTGSATGHFTAPAIIAQDGGNGLPAYALGDIDGDGDIDVVKAGSVYDQVSQYTQTGVVVMLGNGDGTFADPVVALDLGFEPAIVKLADVDGNGDLDIVMAGVSYDAQATPTFSLSVALNDGHGAFTEAGSFTDLASVPSELSLVDLDNDGDLDIVATEHVYGYAGYQTSVHVLLNDGAGVLAQSGATIDAGTGNVQVADIDGDGDLDLVVTNGVSTYDPDLGVYFQSLDVTVFANDSTGSFTASPKISIDGLENGAIEFADIDGDGDLDLLLTTSIDDGYGGFTHWLVVAQNEGDQFEVTASEDLGYSHAIVGDVDGDGAPDLIFNHGDSFTVALNSGTGHFGDRREHFTPVAASSMALGDFDGDGDLDLAVLNVNSFYDPLTLNFVSGDSRLVIVQNQSTSTIS